MKAGDRITVGDTQVTLLSVDAQGLAPTTAVPLAGANPPAQPEPEPYRTAQPPAAQPAAAAPAGPKCPYCYEPIIPNAAKCKHCGTWLDPSRKPHSEPVPAPQPAPVQYHPPAPGWAQPVQPVPVANQGAPGAVMVAQYDKSFVGSAFLVWLLYYLGCYLIGLILNLTYLSEANRHGAMTGRAPSGTGCLWLLLIVHLILPIVAVLILVLLMAVGGLSASDILD